MWQFFRTVAFAFEFISFLCPPLSATTSLAGEVISAANAPSSTFESSRFRVHCLAPETSANAIANHCEQVYITLHARLVGTEQASPWQPKCVVVVHATRRSYLQAVGPGGGQTVGSSLVRVDERNIVERRIDIQAEDYNKGMASLPHEMVHTILADLFPNASLPQWAEEGLATREDTAEKKRRHLLDLRHAMQTNSVLPLPSLFSENNYPTAGQRAVFYGQSLSVVEYLSQRSDPNQFLRFVREYQANGYDRALFTIYGIRNLRELELDWRQHITSQLTTLDLSSN